MKLFKIIDNPLDDKNFNEIFIKAYGHLNAIQFLLNVLGMTHVKPVTCKPYLLVDNPNVIIVTLSNRWNIAIECVADIVEEGKS